MTWRPLFVVGVGRSGTSLLHSALAAHPRVAALPETSLLRELVFSGRLRSAFEREGARGVERVLATCERLERTGVSVDALIAAGLRGAPFSSRRLYEGLLETRASPETSWVLDKDPRLVEALPQIATSWPEARVLHIIRDPRDVISSKKAAPWSSGRSAFAHALIGMGQLALGRWIGPRVLGESYREIRYERLLADPTTVLAEVCSFLDLDYDPTMLDFGAEARRLVADDELAWKKETLGPLLRDNSGKWRSSLLPWEVAIADYTSVPLIEDLGYQPARERAAFRSLGRVVRGASRIGARLAAQVGAGAHG